jgi:predicted aconitase with swiveling domain
VPRRIVLRGPAGIGPTVEGEALVSRHGFSARYDLNRLTGTFSRESHDLYGQSVVGRILVHTTAKGGVATAWALLDMKERGVAPLGLIFQTSNPIMAQGAALAGVAIMHRLQPDPHEVIETGDYLRMDPAHGTVEVEKRAGRVIDFVRVP